MGVRDYVGKNRFPGVLLGLSGGVDSALTLAVAVDALGADRVRALMLPSPYNAPISLDDAREMAGIVGVRYDEIPIEPVFAAFLDALAPEFRDLPPDATEENIQARIRGTLLMALSNKFGSIVLTTGNKSEMAVGYATLYGDMAGGFAVLKDIPKTLVYRLCALPQQPGPRDSGADHHARRRRRNCGPTRPTRTRCRRTTCSTAFSRPTSSRTGARPRSWRMGFPADAVAKVVRLIKSANTSAGSRRWASASRRAASARTGAIRSRRRGTTG